PISTGRSAWSSGSAAATIASRRSSTRSLASGREPRRSAARYARALGLGLHHLDRSVPQARAAGASTALRAGRGAAAAGASSRAAGGARRAPGEVEDARARGAPVAAAASAAAPYL